MYSVMIAKTLYGTSQINEQEKTLDQAPSTPTDNSLSQVHAPSAVPYTSYTIQSTSYMF